MKKMNKKGMIKIIEAVIAIMIIVGAILVAYNEKKTFQKPDLAAKARDILNEIANNASLRSEILLTIPPAVHPNVIPFVNNSLPDYLLFEVKSCSVSSACGQSSYKGEVYSGERVISADTTTYAPVKIRLFIWEA